MFPGKLQVGINLNDRCFDYMEVHINWKSSCKQCHQHGILATMFDKDLCEVKSYLKFMFLPINVLITHQETSLLLIRAILCFYTHFSNIYTFLSHFVNCDKMFGSLFLIFQIILSLARYHCAKRKIIFINGKWTLCNPGGYASPSGFHLSVLPLCTDCSLILMPTHIATYILLYQKVTNFGRSHYRMI